MRKTTLLVTGMLLISGCVVAGATITQTGVARIALSDVAASNDWSGKERDSTIWGLSTDYAINFPVYGSQYKLANKLEYSDQMAGNKKVTTADSIKTTVDTNRKFKNTVINCAVKDQRYFRFDGYTTYYKVGVSKGNSFELKKNTGSTMPVKVAYNAKGSVSKRNSNVSSDTIGLLAETDVIATRGDWAVGIKDADLFISGLNKNSIEMPLFVEYCPKVVFVRYDMIVRGDHRQAGVLRTLKTGVKYSW